MLPSKSSKLDPIPTWLLKLSMDSITPAIHHIVNLSLALGIVPPGMKSALITPILKKPPSRSQHRNCSGSSPQ